MKNFAKTIRYITVAPICALLLNISVYSFKPEAFRNIYELLLIIFVLSIVPLLAYPAQKQFKIIEGNPRESERKLAFIFSIISYIIGAFIAVFTNIPVLQKVIYITYFFSGIFMVIFNFIFNVRASGHMCGFVGPMALVIYIHGSAAYFSIVILILIVWSSLYLKRHKWSDLLVGSMIPVVAMLLSIYVIIQ